MDRHNMRAKLMILAAQLAVSSGTAFGTEFQWQPTGLAGGGSMYVPAISPVDPKLMMVNCDMSGAYLSSDGGRTWAMIHYSQLGGNTRCKPAFHPQDRNVIFAAGGWGGRLSVSRDGGKTWAPIGNLPDGLCGEIAVDPDNPQRMLAGTIGKGVWRSVDAGMNWKSAKGPRGRIIGFHFDRTSPVSGRICFAATDDGIWRSADDGATWTDMSAGLPWRKVRAFAGGSNGKAVRLYCSIEARAVNGAYAGGLFVSADRGETWSSAMGAGINMEIKRHDQWCDGAIAQYRHVLAADADPLTVYAINESTGFWPPYHNTVWRSDDGGASWRAVFYPDPRFKEYNVEPNWRTANILQDYPSAGNHAAVCATNPDWLMFADTMMCYVTSNGGTRWYNAISREAEPGKKEEEARFHNTGLVVTTTWHYYIDPFDRNRHYIAYTDIGFARSTDRGATWNWWGDERDRWTPWRNTCYELAFDPETKGKVWGAFSDVHDIPNDNIILGRHNAKGPGGVCLSVNHGAQWRESNAGLPVAPVTSIALDPRSARNNRTLYAGVWTHGVYKSTDDGKTWTARNNGLGDRTNMRVYRVMVHRDGAVFALITAMKQGDRFLKGGAGIYRSGDGGETWQRISDLLWPKDMETADDNSDIIYVGAADAGAGKQGGLYRTTDGGRTWKRVLRKGPQHFGAYPDPRRAGWVYATLTEHAPGGGLWLSTDNCASWQCLGGLPFANVQRVEFDPDDDSIIYVTTFGGSVWRGAMKR